MMGCASFAAAGGGPCAAPCAFDVVAGHAAAVAASEAAFGSGLL